MGLWLSKAPVASSCSAHLGVHTNSSFKACKKPSEYRAALINSSICLAMFTFQITFESEVCGPEPQFRAIKFHWPLLPASGSH